MAHERIVSTDTAANLIVAWNDDGDIVSLGLEWDEPGPPPAAETAEATTGHRVEHDLGGRVEVPIENYQLRPYFNDAEQRWSIYISLDRPRLNRLIQVTRRARNKAFGADE